MAREEAIHHLYTYSTTNGSGMTTDKQHEEAKRIAIEALEQEPEIIRCKDCKQFRKWVDIDFTFCDLTESPVFETDFCSRAERRQDG